ncbi:MAG: prepilin-type N-terminal cleavage/methylation domain-containing protein [Patescibacteria group bacterium]
MKRVNNNQKGFTILELIIASTVFSLIMLLSTTGLIQIGKTYHKGQITSKTQETTRGVAEEISREVQFSGDPIRLANSKTYGSTGELGGVVVKAVCIGDTRYTYVTGRPKVKLGQSDNPGDGEASPTLRHLLWTDKVATGACVAEDLSNPALSSSGRELLAQNMRLSSFDIDPRGDNVTIKIKAYYGDYDLAGTDGNGFCDSNKNGGQFCASSELSTVVRRRL